MYLFLTHGFRLKTHQTDFWASIQASCAVEMGNSDRNPKIGLMCFDRLAFPHMSGDCMNCCNNANVTEPYLLPNDLPITVELHTDNSDLSVCHTCKAEIVQNCSEQNCHSVQHDYVFSFSFYHERRTAFHFRLIKKFHPGNCQLKFSSYNSERLPGQQWSFESAFSTVIHFQCLHWIPTILQMTRPTAFTTPHWRSTNKKQHYCRVPEHKIPLAITQNLEICHKLQKFAHSYGFSFWDECGNINQSQTKVMRCSFSHHPRHVPPESLGYGLEDNMTITESKLFFGLQYNDALHFSQRCGTPHTKPRHI